MKKVKLFSYLFVVIALFAFSGCNNEVSQDSITKLLPGSWQLTATTWTEGGQTDTGNLEEENIIYVFQEDGQFIPPFENWGTWEVKDNVLIIHNASIGSMPRKRNINSINSSYSEQYIVKKITNTSLQLYQEAEGWSLLYTFKRI